MAGYDDLPLPVRRALQESVNPPPPSAIYRMLALLGINTTEAKHDAAEQVAEAIRWHDDEAVQAHSMRHMTKYGRPSPHVAARATILRESNLPARRPRRFR